MTTELPASSAAPTTGSLMAFDTASMYFRAFYGVPATMTAPDGTPVNAVRGLLDMIARLVEQYRPQALACAWDNDWRPSWRVDLVPSYKAHRVTGPANQDLPTGAGGTGATDAEEAPDDLVTQVPIIQEVLAALDIAVVGVDHHEADDVLGSLATQWPRNCWVVTGDRDLFQLVDETTRVLYVGRGVAKHDNVDAAWVRTTYGVDPDQYVDFSVLRGDPSDGLPGVAGIGDKTAAALITRYASLDGVVAVAGEAAMTPRAKTDMTPRVRSAVLSSLDYLRSAQRVVSVVRDLDLGSTPWTYPDPDLDRCAEVAARWGLASSMTRILQALEVTRTTAEDHADKT